MLGTKNGRRSALADERVNGISGNLLSDQGIASHAANLILTGGRGKQAQRSEYNMANSGSPMTMASSMHIRSRESRTFIAGAVVRQSLKLMPVAMLAFVLAACAGRKRVDNTADNVTRDRTEAAAFDVMRVYQEAGLIAQSTPVPFVGAVQYLATGKPDSTLVHLTLSLANRALTFAREGDAYQAGYLVGLELRRGGLVVDSSSSREVIRVPSFRETSRADESVIYQQQLTLPPGQYDLVLTLRDEHSARTARHEGTLAVPTLRPGDLSSPIPVHEASLRTSTDSALRVVASPRATATFGRDSLFLVYLEAYGDAATVPVVATVRNEKGAEVWTDTVDLSRQGGLVSGVLRLPVSRIGIGTTTLTVQRGDAANTVRTPVFVGFSDNLAVGSFEEMLSYLRYFAPPTRIRALRDTAPEFRGLAWAEFLQETDPVPSTPEHEALRDYFGRIEEANERFREEGGRGWLTDRGMVLVGLGRPDQIVEQASSNASQRNRVQIWEYRQHGAELVFVDQTGFSRWRLTPGSEAEFQSILRRSQLLDR